MSIFLEKVWEEQLKDPKVEESLKQLAGLSYSKKNYIAKNNIRSTTDSTSPTVFKSYFRIIMKVL